MSKLLIKLRILLWFAIRPSYWSHALLFKFRKVTSNQDSASARAEATAWARQRAAPLRDALRHVGLLGATQELPEFPAAEIEGANRRAAACAVRMGGPGDLGLIYSAAMLKSAGRAVETGVAYGWSSLAILLALDRRKDGRLVSVDMPYPGMRNETWVGVVVPDRLRRNWTLIRKPDRAGLRQALRLLGDEIDFAHYDSDKSYAGRMFGYRLLWDALTTGGVFISDDIQDNLAFRDFIQEKNVPYGITESGGKFVGIATKLMFSSKSATKQPAEAEA